MTSSNKKVLLLDAGHGIDTAGKRSPDGVFREYLWNRQVSDLLHERLNSLRWGLDVRQVVTETNDVPLATRAKRVNAVCKEVGADNVLLLSIHSNAASATGQWSSAKGWSCWTSPGATKSDEVAEFMYDAFTAEFKDRKILKELSDGDRDWEANFYILRKTECRAVLLENFFYDNKEEMQWLMTDEAKNRIVSAIIEGLRYFYSQI